MGDSGLENNSELIGDDLKKLSDGNPGEQEAPASAPPSDELATGGPAADGTPDSQSGASPGPSTERDEVTKGDQSGDRPNEELVEPAAPSPASANNEEDRRQEESAAAANAVDVDHVGGSVSSGNTNGDDAGNSADSPSEVSATSTSGGAGPAETNGASSPTKPSGEETEPPPLPQVSDDEGSEDNELKLDDSDDNDNDNDEGPSVSADAGLHRSASAAGSRSRSASVSDPGLERAQSATRLQFVPHRFFLRRDMKTYWTLKVTERTVAKEISLRLGVPENTFRLAFLGSFTAMVKENMLSDDINLWNKMKQLNSILASGRGRFVVVERDELKQVMTRKVQVSTEDGGGVGGGGGGDGDNNLSSSSSSPPKLGTKIGNFLRRASYSGKSSKSPQQSPRRASKDK